MAFNKVYKHLFQESCAVIFIILFYLISLKHLQVNVARHHEMGA